MSNLSSEDIAMKISQELEKIKNNKIRSEKTLKEMMEQIKAKEDLKREMKEKEEQEKKASQKASIQQSSEKNSVLDMPALPG